MTFVKSLVAVSALLFVTACAATTEETMMKSGEDAMMSSDTMSSDTMSSDGAKK